MVEPSADYPLPTGVVSGKPLRPIPNRIAVLYNGTQVQLCCEHCIREFEEAPEKYVLLVREAWK